MDNRELIELAEKCSDDPEVVGRTTAILEIANGSRDPEAYAIAVVMCIEPLLVNKKFENDQLCQMSLIIAGAIDKVIRERKE